MNGSNDLSPQFTIDPASIDPSIVSGEDHDQLNRPISTTGSFVTEEDQRSSGLRTKVLLSLAGVPLLIGIGLLASPGGRSLLGLSEQISRPTPPVNNTRTKNKPVDKTLKPKLFAPKVATITKPLPLYLSLYLSLNPRLKLK